MSNNRFDEQFVISEYNSLRAEALQRVIFRDNALFLTIGIFGGLLTFCMNSSSINAILAYPIIAVFIATIWAHNDYRVGEIGKYIRVRMESQIGYEGWETYLDNKLKKPLFRANIFSAMGIFCISQALSILFVIYYNILHSISLKVMLSGTLFLLLLSLDTISIIYTIYILTIRIKIRDIDID